MNKKIFNTAFTMGATHVNRLYLQHIAFTMAEILLSLTIIGVVAAITLPSLTGNINERTWNTQRKALYARMSQAVALMGNLNGYGIGATQEQTMSNAAKVFVTDGLAKVYKINNICDAEHFADCGIPEKFTKYGVNSKIDVPTDLHNLNSKFSVDYYSLNSQINTKAAAFETQNGESIVIYYYPYCSFTSNLSSYTYLQPTMCANFIYDLNGKKGPNAMGKDIGFMTVFYPTDSQVAMPYPIKHLHVRSDAENDVLTISSSNMACREEYGEEAHMANLEELKSVFVNMELGSTSNNFPNFLRGDGYYTSYNAKLAVLRGQSGQIIVLDTLEHTISERGYDLIFCVK